jgi:hypothetical protein
MEGADRSAVDGSRRWYLFADSSVVPIFARAVLSGFEAPLVQSQVDFLTDNVAVKCVHNFGYGLVKRGKARTMIGRMHAPNDGIKLSVAV